MQVVNNSIINATDKYSDIYVDMRMAAWHRYTFSEDLALSGEQWQDILDNFAIHPIRDLAELEKVIRLTIPDFDVQRDMHIDKDTFHDQTVPLAQVLYDYDSDQHTDVSLQQRKEDDIAEEVLLDIVGRSVHQNENGEYEESSMIMLSKSTMLRNYEEIEPIYGKSPKAFNTKQHTRERYLYLVDEDDGTTDQITKLEMLPTGKAFVECNGEFAEVPMSQIVLL